MPDVKAYAVGDATALAGLSEGDSLLPLLAPGEYNLTLSSTATVTVPALTAGSIVETSPSIGDTLTVSGSNATASATFAWEKSATGDFAGEETTISGATSASYATNESDLTADDHVRRVVTDGVQGPVETAAVQVGAAVTAAINSITGTTAGIVIDYTGPLAITGSTAGATAEAS